MDCVDLRVLGHTHDAVNIEVGLNRTAVFAHEIALIGLKAVQREAVLARIDGDGPQAKLGRGTANADGDFAAIGDKELAYRARPTLTLGHPR